MSGQTPGTVPTVLSAKNAALQSLRPGFDFGHFRFALIVLSEQPAYAAILDAHVAHRCLVSRDRAFAGSRGAGGKKQGRFRDRPA